MRVVRVRVDFCRGSDDGAIAIRGCGGGGGGGVGVRGVVCGACSGAFAIF